MLENVDVDQRLVNQILSVRVRPRVKIQCTSHQNRIQVVHVHTKFAFVCMQELSPTSCFNRRPVSSVGRVPD